MSRAFRLACWAIAVLLIVSFIVLLLPFAFTSACKSSPMTLGLMWLHEIQFAQVEVRKGILGAGSNELKGGYWRKNIRELESCVVNGKPASLISRRIADSDIAGNAGNVVRPISEISLRSLTYVGEPPLDFGRYAVVMWVHEWGRMGWWTLIASQDGIWAKAGKNELEHFPNDPSREGWLPEPEVKRILSKAKRLDHWVSFWRFEWI
jgi:hypothetical protein